MQWQGKCLDFLEVFNIKSIQKYFNIKKKNQEGWKNFLYPKI